jgi:formylglycine-generating enzyme
MSGNVLEWVQDIYAADAYGKHARGNPIYESSGSSRAMRGGSWGGYAGGARCAHRSNGDPGEHGSYLGLRLARTP